MQQPQSRPLTPPTVQVQNNRVYSIPTPPSPPANIFTSNKYSPSPPPTPNRTMTMSPSIIQQQQQSYNSMPARNGTVSPATVRTTQMSPTPAMLQNQIDRLQTRKDVPIRNQERPQPPPTPSFNDRRNSYSAAENIKARMVNKTKTPTFGELQFRYGNDRTHSPSPVLDKDYQKEARQTVVGELSR